METALSLICLALIILTIAGLVKPSLAASTPVTRWATSRPRILGAGLVSVLAVGAFLPGPTPEELAERAAREAARDSTRAAEEASEAAQEAREEEAEARQERADAAADSAIGAEYVAELQAESAAETREDSVKAAQEALVAHFGRAPLIGPWKGGSHDVERHLQAAARNPDSIETEGCTQPIPSTSAAGLGLDLPEGWLISCTWRGENGFGGMNVEQNSFVLRDRGGLMTVIWTDIS